MPTQTFIHTQKETAISLYRLERVLSGTSPNREIYCPAFGLKPAFSAFSITSDHLLPFQLVLSP